MRPIYTLSIALLALLLNACGAQVPVTLIFPSQQVLDQSVFVTLDVYDGTLEGDTAPDAICRALSSESSAPGNLRPLSTSAEQDLCSFVRGDFALEDVPVQRAVLFVKIENQEGTDLLRGCTVADVYSRVLTCGEEELCPPSYQCGSDGICAIALPLATLPSYVESEEVRRCE